MNGVPYEQQLAFVEALYRGAGSPELRLMLLSLAESIKDARKLRDYQEQESLRGKRPT